ncbi:hypothetical protein BWQ95_21720 [Aeromonas hydrophila]|nr:hypothetical protein BWQ95_21720 [Aeromonas hydrophila]
MMNPFSWLQMTNMISYQGLVRTFPGVIVRLVRAITSNHYLPIEFKICKQVLTTFNTKRIKLDSIHNRVK